MATKFIAALILAALAGCSEPRNAVFDPDAGRHETANWLPDGHALFLASRASGTVEVTAYAEGACGECHGADLGGGISGVSCNACHLGGPALAHPAQWSAPAPDHAPFVLANGSGSCANQYCHGSGLDGIIDSGPSCSGCHLGGPAGIHPESWTNRFRDHGPYALANGVAACSSEACHGPALAGVAGSGPGCDLCHDWPLAPGAAVTLKCAACHGRPPDGFASPNRAGSHAKHDALNNVSCADCHGDADGSAGNALHIDGTVEISVSAAYSSKSGTATFEATTKTCSRVSCHGGPRTQTQAQAILTAPTSSARGSGAQSTESRTPTWYGGRLDDPTNVSARCVACHTFNPVQAAEYNNYFSGGHFIHMWDPLRGPQPKYLCSDCHDFLALAASHFTTLNTASMEGPAQTTVQLTIQYDGFTCNAPCHVPRNWDPALVPVP